MCGKKSLNQIYFPNFILYYKKGIKHAYKMYKIHVISLIRNGLNQGLKTKKKFNRFTPSSSCIIIVPKPVNTG